MDDEMSESGTEMADTSDHMEEIFSEIMKPNDQFNQMKKVVFEQVSQATCKDVGMSSSEQENQTIKIENQIDDRENEGFESENQMVEPSKKHMVEIENQMDDRGNEGFDNRMVDSSKTQVVVNKTINTAFETGNSLFEYENKLDNEIESHDDNSKLNINNVVEFSSYNTETEAVEQSTGTNKAVSSNFGQQLEEVMEQNSEGADGVEQDRSDIMNNAEKTKSVLGVVSIKAEPVDFFCEVCGTLCDGPTELSIHYRAKHNRNVSVCELCGAQFKTSIPFYIHCKHAHGVIKEIKCVCSRVFLSVKSIKEHHEECKIYRLVNQSVARVCHVCGEQFALEGLYNRHVLKHHKASKEFTCKVCGQSFKRSSSLYNHERTVHSEADLKCPFCMKCIKTKMGIMYHVYTHKEIDMYAKEEENGGTPCYFCPLCSHTETKRPSMKQHILVQHNFKKTYGKKQKNKKTGDESSKLLSNPEPFTPCGMTRCEICGRVCPSHGAWKDHMALHAGEVTVMCTICNRGFVTKHAYRKHMRTIHQQVSGTLRQNRQSPYVSCEVCSRKICRTGLAKHMDIHKGIYRYKCEVCEKLCRSYHDLTVHRRIHTGEKPFRCSICDRSFADQANVRHHQKRIHGLDTQPNPSVMRKTGFHKKFTAEELAAMKRWDAEHGLDESVEPVVQESLIQEPLKGKFHIAESTQGRAGPDKAKSKQPKLEKATNLMLTNVSGTASSQNITNNLEKSTTKDHTNKFDKTTSQDLTNELHKDTSQKDSNEKDQDDTVVIPANDTDVFHVVSEKELQILAGKVLVNSSDAIKLSEDSRIIKLTREQSELLETIKESVSESREETDLISLDSDKPQNNFEDLLQKGSISVMAENDVIFQRPLVVSDGKLYAVSQQSDMIEVDQHSLMVQNIGNESTSTNNYHNNIIVVNQDSLIDDNEFSEVGNNQQKIIIKTSNSNLQTSELTSF